MGIFILAEKQNLIVEEERQKELEQKKPVPPSYDIKKLLKENDLEDAIKKVEENNVDTEAFWDLDNDKMKEVLGVETFGKRKNLLTIMAEIKKKHQEEVDKKIKVESDIKIDRNEIIKLIK